MSSLSEKKNLTQGPVRGHLIRMSIPMLWGILSMISVQLMDTYYISRLGTRPLTAISFTFPVTMTIFSLIIGLGVAMSSVLSRKIGAGLKEEAVYIASHGIILAILSGAAMGLCGLAILRPLFHGMGANDAQVGLILSYMKIWFPGCAVMALPLVGNSAMRANGDTLTPAFIMMGLSLLNAALAALLVFGLAGFPALGVEGAAIATVLSYTLAATASLFILKYKKRLIFQGSLHLEQLGSSFRQLLLIALPVSIGSMLQPIGQGVLTELLSVAGGGHAVAAFGVVTRLEAMVFVLVIALSSGMSPIIGQNWGAQRYDRVLETLRDALKFSVAWSLLVAVIMGLLARPLAGLFTHDPDVIHDIGLYFLIVPFSYAAGNLAMGWMSAFNAMGQPRRALMIIFMRMIVLQIPLAMLGGRLFGVGGIFASIAIVNMATGLFYHFRSLPELKDLVTDHARAQMLPSHPA